MTCGRNRPVFTQAAGPTEESWSATVHFADGLRSAIGEADDCAAGVDGLGAVLRSLCYAR
jgi:hypothetical protein